MIVPTTLVLLAVAVAPWTFDGPVLTLEVPLASDMFNLGGVLGTIPDTVVFCIGLDPPRTVFVPNRGTRDPSSDSSDTFGSSAPHSSIVFVL